MKLIPLTQGQFAIVDDIDFIKFGRFSWRAMWSKNTGSFYAIRSAILNGKKVTLLLHREVLGLKRSSHAKGDHKDHDTLDCRRRNLRPATNSQNQSNRRMQVNNTSGARGVCWDKSRSRWHAKIKVNMKTLNLGRFRAKASAVRAYSDANQKYFGKFGGQKIGRK